MTDKDSPLRMKIKRKSKTCEMLPINSKEADRSCKRQSNRICNGSSSSSSSNSNSNSITNSCDNDKDNNAILSVSDEAEQSITKSTETSNLVSESNAADNFIEKNNGQSVLLDGSSNKRKGTVNKNIDSPTGKKARKDAGMNTPTVSKATITEPECLGPCEPGTNINLDGIVWLETTTGMLVVNVTWRGRTYVGTLLDSSQHEFAPPTPNARTSRSGDAAKRRRRQQQVNGGVGGGGGGGSNGGNGVSLGSCRRRATFPPPEQQPKRPSPANSALPVCCPHPDCAKRFVSVVAMKWHHNECHSRKLTPEPVFKVPELRRPAVSSVAKRQRVRDGKQLANVNSNLSGDAKKSTGQQNPGKIIEHKDIVDKTQALPANSIDKPECVPVNDQSKSADNAGCVDARQAVVKDKLTINESLANTIDSQRDSVKCSVKQFTSPARPAHQPPVSTATDALASAAAHALSSAAAGHPLSRPLPAWPYFELPLSQQKLYELEQLRLMETALAGFPGHIPPFLRDPFAFAAAFPPVPK